VPAAERLVSPQAHLHFWKTSAGSGPVRAEKSSVAAPSYSSGAGLNPFAEGLARGGWYTNCYQQSHPMGVRDRVGATLAISGFHG
jgi:hypothetical protein